ncbi:MAG: hypothetical protein K2K02_04130 [Ruminococcus sp.]|nr:hypothetical protein [Ruminococcus sp.]
MKTDKKRSFKGAVLFTVVSVMSLLIVFLTSTLVLATAANNRAHKSYSSSQASYTARAAIDSILKAASEDENFATAMTALSTGGGFDVDVTMESSATGLGKVDKARIEYAGKKQFYDASKQEWIERDLISITADVTSGGETKTVTAYALKNPPVPGNGSGGGGGFVAVGTAGTANHTLAFGGTYLGIGMSKGARYYQGNYYLPGGQMVSLEDKFYLNRKDDLPGVKDETTQMLIPNLPETVDADNIVTYSFGNEGSIEAPVVINGNFYSNTQTEIYFPTKGTGMSVWGNMKFQNESSFKLASNPNITPEKFNEIPYIYVDSLFEANKTELKFNTNGDFPLNMFCGSVNLRNANIGADIYCQDSNKTSVLSGDANTTLYKWSDSVINRSSYLDSAMSGNFYSKGSAIVKDTNNWVTINGDMVIEKDLEVTGKLKVTGSLVVGGTLKCDGELDVTGNISATNAEGSKISSNSVKKMASNGIDELYEQQERIKYYVLGINVQVGTNNYLSAWLSPDVITAYSLPDSDGDGIVDGNYRDFSGIDVDPAFFVEEVNWDDVDSGLFDLNSEIREHSRETVWVNRDNPADVTTNEADTFEAGNLVYNGTVNIGDPSLYKAVHNNELFPRKAEKAVILGLEEIGDGTPGSSSKVLKYVDEVEDDYNFKTKSITKIPSEGNYLADVTANVYTNDTLPAEITTSCTLSGTFDKNIIIKNTSTNDIWVKLDNFTLQNNGDIIYDDSMPSCGNLNIFVENSANFLTGRSIYSKTYKDLIDNHTKFQIATYSNCYLDEATGGVRVEAPKINIYSKEIEYNIEDGTVKSQPYFNMSNGASIVTACIEAPHMKFNITNAKNLSGQEIYYNGRKISEAPGYNGSVGVIGILNIAEGDMQNNWVFLYTPKTTSCTCPPSCVCGGACTDCKCSESSWSADKSFDIMYYEGF